MASDANSLLDQAKCYLCLGSISTEGALQLALLAQIAGQFGSGASAPSAAPANANAPAQYFNTSNRFTYNWDVGSQSWVPVPKVYRAMLEPGPANTVSVTLLQNTLGESVTWVVAGINNSRFVATRPSGFVPSNLLVKVTLGFNDSSQGELFQVYVSPGPNTLIIEIVSPQSGMNWIWDAADVSVVQRVWVEALVYP